MDSPGKMGDQNSDCPIIFHRHNNQVFRNGTMTKRTLALKLRSQDRGLFSELGPPLRDPFFVASFLEKICWSY